MTIYAGCEIITSIYEVEFRLQTFTDISEYHYLDYRFKLIVEDQDDEEDGCEKKPDEDDITDKDIDGDDEDDKDDEGDENDSESVIDIDQIKIELEYLLKSEEKI